MHHIDQKFYTSIEVGSFKKKTMEVHKEDNLVEWKENIDTLMVHHECDIFQVETTLCAVQDLQESSLGKIYHVTCMALDKVEVSEFCKSLVRKINWVIDFIGLIAEVLIFSFDMVLAKFHSKLNPFAQLAVGLISMVPKAQFLRHVRPQVEQADTLRCMLGEVFDCRIFILSYGSDMEVFIVPLTGHIVHHIKMAEAQSPIGLDQDWAKLVQS
ncbi:hypothetical protein CPB84DRAFT_1751512 [Gymnopilus junonius]|uniref:Uncharacterized protein n=1 Tax=Gymnopilus junonius TaxID=109634 RepID=A0A9P5NC67_GYMJU|nr:hypothetical protein CPB84DRAFT_1751512 [Gymnopilus junonius]